MAHHNTPVAVLHFWRYVSEVFERLMYFGMYAGGFQSLLC